jgi:hypothetical protein
MRNSKIIALLTLFLLSCSSPFLKYKDENRLNIDEGIPDVTVKEIAEDPNVAPKNDGVIPAPKGEVLGTITNETKNDKKKSSVETGAGASTSDLLGAKGKDNKKGKKKKRGSEAATGPKLREPRLENAVGFSNGARRPDQDPFRVGEKVVMAVKYFKAQAGEMTLEVKPLVEVDGRKSYRWVTGLRTTGMFSKFYSIQDVAETLVDYETLLPSVFTLQVKESAQLRNGKGYFNPKTRKGVYIEKKYTESKGQQDKRQEWTIDPWAQNVFSAAFYMRVFNYEVGKEIRFTVADEEKNITFKAKALRKEKIDTEAGEFNTIVVKPEFEIDGIFKPVGDIFFWLTDDDRKMIVKIESEIKIGTLIMQAISVERGI